MNKRNCIIMALVLIGVTTVVASFYAVTQTPATESEEEMRVVVTIVPQAEFVEKLGGDRVLVTVLVPPGASPHTYEPTPSQMKEVAKAKMYAKVGSGIEFELVWMDKIVETNPNMLIVDCSYGIQLIDMTKSDKQEGKDHQRVGKDPHIWLSPRNAIVMVENIYEGLVEIDPDNKEYYTKNKNVYVTALEDLDVELSEIFSGLTTKKFMVYHPAWGYLAHDYSLEQIPIEEAGKAPTPEGLTRLVDQAREHDIKLIFATPEFESKTAETVADEIGGNVILVSPLAEDYINNLTKISEEMTKRLV